MDMCNKRKIFKCCGYYLDEIGDKLIKAFEKFNDEINKSGGYNVQDNLKEIRTKVQKKRKKQPTALGYSSECESTDCTSKYNTTTLGSAVGRFVLVRVVTDHSVQTCSQPSSYRSAYSVLVSAVGCIILGSAVIGFVIGKVLSIDERRVGTK